MYYLAIRNAKIMLDVICGKHELENEEHRTPMGQQCRHPPEPSGGGLFCLLEVLFLKLAQLLPSVSLQFLSLLQDDWEVCVGGFCVTAGWTSTLHYKEGRAPSKREEGHTPSSP